MNDEHNRATAAQYTAELSQEIQMLLQDPRGQQRPALYKRYVVTRCSRQSAVLNSAGWCVSLKLSLFNLGICKIIRSHCEIIAHHYSLMLQDKKGFILFIFIHIQSVKITDNHYDLLLTVWKNKRYRTKKKNKLPSTYPNNTPKAPSGVTITAGATLYARKFPI